jgi:hypothetical protein
LKEAALHPSTDQGDDGNMEAAGGKGPNLVLLTNQGAPTTNATSRTQAQSPPNVLVNIVGNMTKGE